MGTDTGHGAGKGQGFRVHRVGQGSELQDKMSSCGLLFHQYAKPSFRQRWEVCFNIASDHERLPCASTCGRGPLPHVKACSGIFIPPWPPEAHLSSHCSKLERHRSTLIATTHCSIVLNPDIFPVSKQASRWKKKSTSLRRQSLLTPPYRFQIARPTRPHPHRLPDIV